ncbi:hypothetical protein DFH27DRAFT_566011 [Peziza echinospora]|nr:hypothetical protein DFH27DRAFT_566011 [Peziza echinospora]
MWYTHVHVSLTSTRIGKGYTSIPLFSFLFFINCIMHMYIYFSLASCLFLFFSFSFSFFFFFFPLYHHRCMEPERFSFSLFPFCILRLVFWLFFLAL